MAPDYRKPAAAAEQRRAASGLTQVKKGTAKAGRRMRATLLHIARLRAAPPGSGPELKRPKSVHRVSLRKTQG